MATTIRKNIKPKIKAHVSEYTINLGPVINFTTALLPIKVSASRAKKPTYQNLSPDNNPVQRVWRDVETGSIWEESDLKKAHEDKVEGTVTIVEADEAAEASRSTLAKNFVSFTVHKTADVADRLFTSDHVAYLLKKPEDKRAEVAYNRLLTMVHDFPEYTIMGASNVKGYDGLFRLVVWRGQLAIVRMLYPEQVNEHEFLDLPEESEDNRKLFGAMLSKMCADFNAEDYQDLSAQRHVALLSGESVTEAPKGENDDMLDMMRELYGAEG